MYENLYIRKIKNSKYFRDEIFPIYGTQIDKKTSTIYNFISITTCRDGPNICIHVHHDPCRIVD